MASSSGPLPTEGSADSWKNSFTGWRFKRDRNRFIFAVTACCLTYAGVMFSEWKERNRRHSSIQKDIEREQWRAAQLGLTDKRDVVAADLSITAPSPADDGFAQQYIEQLKNSGSYIENVAASFITTKSAAAAAAAAAAAKS